MDVMKAIEVRRTDLTRWQIENDTISKQISDHAGKLSRCKKMLALCQAASVFLADLSNSRRTKMKSKIERAITEAFALIYGPNYRVELVYDMKANRSSAQIEMVKTTSRGEVRRQLSSTGDGGGGGVFDTVAVPLRFLVLIASRQTDKVCLLDESYKHMDGDRIDRVAQFIRAVAEKRGLQVILCSHHAVMQHAADTVWELYDRDGVAEAKQIA